MPCGVVGVPTGADRGGRPSALVAGEGLGGRRGCYAHRSWPGGTGGVEGWGAVGAGWQFQRRVVGCFKKLARHVEPQAPRP